MPRLVRLTTNDTQCRFRAKFGQGFKLRPNGKVALKNLTLSLNPKQFDINDDNNGITWNVDNDNLTDRTAVISTGTYSINNIDTLYDSLESVLNANTGTYETDSKEIGLEWQVKTDSATKKTNIQYKVARVLDPVPNMDVYGSTTKGIDFLSNQSAVGGASLNKYACRGGGHMRFNVDPSASASAIPHIVIGFTTTNPDSLASVTIADVDIGVAVNRLGTNYQIVNGGVVQAAGVGTTTVAQNDILAFEKLKVPQLGAAGYVLTVYDSTGTRKQQLDYLPTGALVSDKLYPVVVFPTASLNRVGLGGFTQSPYIDTATGTFAAGLGDVPTQPPLTATNNYLEFESTDLSEILGFNNRRQPISGFTSATEWSITANNIANPGLKGNSLILELENLSLNSRNFNDDEDQNGQRRPILATIPQTGDDLGITHIEPFPVYLDLQNQSELEVKNLNLRVLNRDLEPVDIEGEAVLTLLFD